MTERENEMACFNNIIKNSISKLLQSIFSNQTSTSIAVIFSIIIIVNTNYRTQRN